MTRAERIKIEKFIQSSAMKFQRRKLDKLKNISAKTIIKKIDPYLLNLSDVSTKLKWSTLNLDRIMVASEETLKGNMYEEIAFFIAKTRFKAKKTAGYLDLVIPKDKLYITEIKSGPHWGNSSQWESLVNRFNKVRTELSGGKQEVQPLLGICYGSLHNPHGRHGILELRGQAFWEFLTDEPNFYILLAQNLKVGSEKYIGQYRIKRNATINRLAVEIQDFCLPNGELNKELILQYSSAKEALGYVTGCSTKTPVIT
jgi:hypothetical protein